MAESTASLGNLRASEARTATEINSESGEDEKDPLKRIQNSMGEKGLKGLVSIMADFTHTCDPILGRFDVMLVGVMIHLASVATNVKFLVEPVPSAAIQRFSQHAPGTSGIVDLKTLIQSLRDQYIQTQQCLITSVDRFRAFGITHDVYLQQLRYSAGEFEQVYEMNTSRQL
jgi:hypothetical protein